MPHHLQQLIDQFLKNESDRQSLTTATINNYHFYLTRFCSMTGAREPGDITKEAVARFAGLLKKLRNRRGGLMNPTTQNYHLIALRTFLNYLTEQHITALNPDDVPLQPIQYQPVHTITPSQVETLLEAPLTADETEIIKNRDKAILELLLTTGLKVAELAGLRRDQIQDNREELIIKKVGTQARTVPLTTQTRYWLRQYLRLRTDGSAALFIRHDKAKKRQAETDFRLTPRTIQRIIKKYVKSSRLPQNITPQSLRQAYARKLLEQGTDLTEVQLALGHTSLATTKLYAKNQ